jgi:hypothetical protein
MASAQPTANAWQPNGKRRGRNSGTKGSVNDRPCANCGEVREHKQNSQNTPPPKVYCPECHRNLKISNPNLRMRNTKEDDEKAARLKREGRARGHASQSAAAQEKVAAIIEDKPLATQEEIDAEYDKLWGQIKGGRPAAGGLFWWLGCGLICLCNCAICLLAESYAPAVFMVFIYLCGCIPAKTGDVVAIPKDYIAWGVAVSTLMFKRYPGRFNPRAFIRLRALEQAESGRNMPTYDHSGLRNLNSTYDSVQRYEGHRISLCAAHNEDALMPGAMYDKERDWLGVFQNESAGQSGIGIIAFPLLIKDESSDQYRKTVVAAKCKRRQFVMAFLFTSVLSAVSWVPALVRDFAVLKEQAKPVTIGVQISN